MKRKKEVELLRIWFTLAVCFHHLRYCTDVLPFGGGYIAVDFFFIVSGFYLNRRVKWDRKDNRFSMIRFTVNRYVRLIKDYFLAFCLAVAVDAALFKVNFFSYMWEHIREGLMIQLTFARNGGNVNPPDWYCFYLVIVSAFVYLLIYLFKNHFRIFSLLVPILCYRHLYIKYGNINIYPAGPDMIWDVCVRGIAGLLIGVFLSELCESECFLKKVSGKVLTAVFAVLFFICSYMVYWAEAYSISDYFCVIFMGILFYLSQKVEIKCLNCMGDKLWNCLSEMTYVMFLNHYVVVKVFDYFHLFQYGDWKIICLLYLMTVLVCSLAMFELRKCLVKIIKCGVGPRLKQLVKK